LGLLIGWWLDSIFGWAPWAMIIGAMLGVASGMYLLIKKSLNMDGKR
jgi:F0F1-type ATP synthase assembly protein I